MENNVGPNPFPPPPRRVLAPVVLILIFFAALAGGSYLVWELVRGDAIPPPPESQPPEAKAETELAALERALKYFQKSAARFPTVTEGLDALVHRPASLPDDPFWPKFGAKIPDDPWGRPYQYVEVPGAPGSYRVFSQGPDATSPDDDISITLTAPPPATPAFRTTK